jgi:methylenetetrahydrofolate reductase (NADPH)
MTGANIPQEISKKMEPYKDNPSEIYKRGLELAIDQCRDLLDNGAPGIHFYTLNKSRAAVDLYENLAKDFKEVKNCYEKSFTPHIPAK